MEETDFENAFLRLLEKHENEVLRLSTFLVVEQVESTCTKCQRPFSHPEHVSLKECPKCRPPITLERDHFESLLQEKRDELFAQLGELDEEFRGQPAVALREKVLDEWGTIKKWTEACGEAADILEDTATGCAEFSREEFGSLVNNLLRLVSIDRMGALLGLSDETRKMVLQTKTDVLFGRKPPRQIPIEVPK